MCLRTLYRIITLVILIPVFTGCTDAGPSEKKSNNTIIPDNSGTDTTKKIQKTIEVESSTIKLVSEKTNPEQPVKKTDEKVIQKTETVELKPEEIQPPGKNSWPTARNGLLQQGVANSELPEKLELLWKIKTADGVVSTAAIVGKFVYVGALNGYLYCIDRISGKIYWKYRSIENLDPEEFAAGFKGGPNVTEKYVYIGDEDGIIHAVDRLTGKKKWIFQTDAEVAGCPTINDGKLIVGSHDSFLYCLNAEDGKVIWRFQTNDRVNCSAAISGGSTFIAGCDAFLRVIDISKGEEVRKISLESYLIASPAVVGDMLYVGTYASEVMAINWKTGNILWRYKDPKKEFPYHGSASVTDKHVYVGGRDKQLHCIDRLTGKGIWKFKTRGQIDSSPVISGNRIFFGSNDRNIYAISLDQGKEVWKYNLGNSVVASPAIGEGCLVICAEGSNGEIFCFGKKQ